jgi:flagellar basal body L-ring protein FlgH
VSGSIPLRVNAVDLVGDLKARNVGDLVTVQVVESFSSESKAGTDLANKRSLTVNLKSPRGLEIVKDLARKLKRYIGHYNHAPKPIKWTYRDPSHRISVDTISPVTGH